MPTFSQVDLIASRSWERAFFTTYALSLSFFESYLLPRLRQARCEHVTVLVDSDGYRASLMERKAQAIGQEYALIPVQSKTGGVFHPKVTYLWGQEGDLLLVGSGNLTFGGHGRNIEVLEVLEPVTDTAAFRDFADFVDLLNITDTLSIPDRIGLVELGTRAREQIAGRELGGSTRLLHSLQTPVLEQLVQRAETAGPWTELVCLSPYHHATGEPIRRLVEDLGVQSLQIGVPPSSKNSSAFPFEAAKKWGPRLSVVAPNVEKPERPLHAKWFELRGAQRWTLTGSVNATHQSLATTKNVEVSVLRKLETGDTDNWKPATKPHCVPNDFSTVGANQDPIVHALFSMDGSIKGQILGTGPFAGSWAIRLQMGDAEGLPDCDTVTVDTDGNFHWKPTNFDEFRTFHTAQLTLERGEIKARGWLSFQSLLKLPSRSRAAQAAIARMVARGGTLSDYQVVLDYIALHASRLWALPATRIRPEAQRVSEPDSAFSLAELTVDPERTEAELLRELAHEASTHDRPWKALSLVTRLLAGRTLRGHTTSGETTHRKSRAEQDEEDDPAEREAATSALTQFNDQLYQQFTRAKGEDRNLVPLLVVWLNVNLDMRLRRLGDTPGAFAFAEQWIRRAVTAPIPPDVRASLSDSVYGVAAALALKTRNLSKRTAALQWEEGLSPGEIHQWLETYEGTTLDHALACEHAKAWFQTETPVLLVEHAAQAAVDALAALLNVPTPRTYLDRLITAFERGELVTIPEEAFGTIETRLLQALVKAPRPRHRRINKNAIGCPKCWVRLLGDIRSTLRRRRIAECIQCHAILLLLEP